MPSDDFEQIVSQHYEPLYRFAFSLTHAEADACDLTQQTFYIWATKGHQLRDRSKVKSWLFTILHREFLNIRKRALRFPHFELNDGIEDHGIEEFCFDTFKIVRCFLFEFYLRELRLKSPQLLL